MAWVSTLGTYKKRTMQKSLLRWEAFILWPQCDKAEGLRHLHSPPASYKRIQSDARSLGQDVAAGIIELASEVGRQQPHHPIGSQATKGPQEMK